MKNKKIIIGILIIFAIIITLSAISNVSAIDLVKIEDVNVDSEKTVEIDNTNAPKFVSAPKTYSKSAKYVKTKGFEIKRNIINTKVGKKYTFITKYFLPMTWKDGGKNGNTEYWYNCQSIVVDGKYIYIYTSAGYGSNRGFIVRYDTEILDKYIKGKGINKLRKLGDTIEKRKPLSKEQKKIMKGIKIGKKFIGGHGQSLKYNPKTKSLWMWQDNNHNSSDLKLMKISTKTLKPYEVYKFKVKLNGKYLKQFNNLAFDEDGNFYTDKTIKNNKTSSGSSYIFTGNIVNGTLQMKLSSIIHNRPGTHAQSLAVNNKNNRLYLVSDGVIYSVPISKLRDSSLKMDDFEYNVFSTKREFEGISFDKDGEAYLLILRGTEILKSVGLN